MLKFISKREKCAGAKNMPACLNCVKTTVLLKCPIDKESNPKEECEKQKTCIKDVDFQC